MLVKIVCCLDCAIVYSEEELIRRKLRAMTKKQALQDSKVKLVTDLRQVQNCQ